MTKTRKRLVAAALGTAGLLCAPLSSFATTAAAAPVAASSTADIRAADECWKGAQGVTCVSANHNNLRDCDRTRHAKRAAGYFTSACRFASNTIAWRPYYFLYG